MCRLPANTALYSSYAYSSYAYSSYAYSSYAYLSYAYFYTFPLHTVAFVS
jgi:hypothetical protein